MLIIDIFDQLLQVQIDFHLAKNSREEELIEMSFYVAFFQMNNSEISC